MMERARSYDRAVERAEVINGLGVKRDEDTTVHDLLHALISETFDSFTTITFWANGESHSSREQRRAYLARHTAKNPIVGFPLVLAMHAIPAKSVVNLYCMALEGPGTYLMAHVRNVFLATQATRVPPSPAPDPRSKSTKDGTSGFVSRMVLRRHRHIFSEASVFEELWDVIFKNIRARGLQVSAREATMITSKHRKQRTYKDMKNVRGLKADKAWHTKSGITLLAWGGGKELSWTASPEEGTSCRNKAIKGSKDCADYNPNPRRSVPNIIMTSIGEQRLADGFEPPGARCSSEKSDGYEEAASSAYAADRLGKHSMEALFSGDDYDYDDEEGARTTKRQRVADPDSPTPVPQNAGFLSQRTRPLPSLALLASLAVPKVPTELESGSAGTLPLSNSVGILANESEDDSEDDDFAISSSQTTEISNTSEESVDKVPKTLSALTTEFLQTGQLRDTSNDTVLPSGLVPEEEILKFGLLHADKEHLEHSWIVALNSDFAQAFSEEDRSFLEKKWGGMRTNTALLDDDGWTETMAAHSEDLAGCLTELGALETLCDDDDIDAGTVFKTIAKMPVIRQGENLAKYSKIVGMHMQSMDRRLSLDSWLAFVSDDRVPPTGGIPGWIPASSSGNKRDVNYKEDILLAPEPLARTAAYFDQQQRHFAQDGAVHRELVKALESRAKGHERDLKHLADMTRLYEMVMCVLMTMHIGASFKGQKAETT
ncbi:hypothetical protein HDU86_008118 [Geranomyces michiganensis]|nr:hypothetical protein HDU86_008118 [Geranomyces michiganensis]